MGALLSDEDVGLGSSVPTPKTPSSNGSQSLLSDESVGLSPPTHFAQPAAQARSDFQTAHPILGYADNAMRALAHGVPFADDIAALGDTGTSYARDAVSRIPGIGPMIGPSAQQGKTFGQRFAENDAAQHEISNVDAKKAPITNMVAPIVGAVASSLATAPEAAVGYGVKAVAPFLGNTGTKVATSALTGAGLGAAYGASNGDTIDERMQNAKEGAIFGGSTGVVAPVIAGGVSKAVGAGKNLVQGIFNPEVAGQKAAIDAIAGDRASGSGVLMSDADVAAAQNAGQPIVAADLGGQNTRRIARTLANKSPEAQAALTDATADRFATQNTRLPDFLQTIYGGNIDARAAQDAISSQGKLATGPAYAKARAEGANGVWNPNLSQLASAPDIQDAIGGAIRSSANESAMAGAPQIKNPFIKDTNGFFQLGTDAQGNPVKPTFDFWNQVKIGLNGKIKAAQRAGDNGAFRQLTMLKNALVGQLDQELPSYAAARQTAFDVFQAGNALDAGKNILSTSASPQEIGAAISKMTPAQQNIFGYGAASAIMQKPANVSDLRNVVGMFNTPAIREKLQLAMGPQKADQLETWFRVESSMNILKNSIGGNYSTAEQGSDLLKMAANHLSGPLAGAALGTAEAYREEGFGDPALIAKYAALGAFGGAMKKVMSGQNTKMIDAMAEALSSDNPQVYADTIKRISSNSQMKAGVQKLSNMLTFGAANAGANASSTSSPPE